jgi:ATP-dependent exoDNAse (exonuclease V) alpha subunit
VGDFPDKIFPVEEKFKVGAQVMFVKTIYHSKNYFNGKMGIIKSLSSQEILSIPEENKTIEVDKYEWQNIRQSRCFTK